MKGLNQYLPKIGWGILLSWSVAVTAEAEINTASSDEAALSLFQQMGQALTQLSYNGIFTHEHSGNLDPIRITHQVINDVEANRFKHLTGSANAIVQRSDASLCAREDLSQQTLLPRADDSLDSHYLLKLVGEDRVADRSVYIVNALPRDEFRYGYRLALDTETAMPLMMATISGNRMLERFQFIDFQPVTNTAEVVDGLIEPKRDEVLLLGGCVQTADSAHWRLGWVPSGFQLISAKVTDSAEMLAFSDGMSRFSVFVSRVLGRKTLEGEARRGGTLVYLDKIVIAGEPYQVSIVGEVPKTTAQKVASAVIPLARR